MCGIAGGDTGKDYEAARKALHHRGPDGSGHWTGQGYELVHTRLSIIDPHPRSAQPMKAGRTVISFNGEIWNFRALRRLLEAQGRSFKTEGDTEVVAHALDLWGEKALEMFHGMFALAWVREGDLKVATDRFGEVPVHLAPGCFASEIKGLAAMGHRVWKTLGPGSVALLDDCSTWNVRRYYDPPAVPIEADPADAAFKLRSLLFHSVVERTMTDVPACTLLSGGIDSAAVAGYLRGRIPGLIALTAVLDPRSPDLRAARLCAEALEMELVEVKVEPPTADDLSEVVRTIEMPYKAQVEIAWACLALGDVMRDRGIKVTFSGEGSDELWASYGFSYHGLRKKDWFTYRKDLFLDQHRKNFARCNKAFMARSVECRLPFLNRDLVQHALSLPRSVVVRGKRPKAVLEDAVADVVPPAILRRSKLAFQDGMGLKSAIAETVADPKRFYRAEFLRAFA